MEGRKQSIAEIHLAVLLFGFAGLFAKFTSQSSIIITLGRVLFASTTLLMIFFIRKQKIRLSSANDYIFLLISGVILAFHWITFFQSIKVSTVAIGLITYSTFPAFTVLFEPYFFGEKFILKNLFISFLCIAGIILIIPEYEFSNNITQGAIWGVISGLSFAFLQIYNRKFVQKYSSLTITFYQTGTATFILLPSLFLSHVNFTGKDILIFVLLGIVFTAFAHSLFIKGLKFIKVQTAGLIALLEPVYGIFFALFLINEIPSFRIISGGLIIIVSTLYLTVTSGK